MNADLYIPAGYARAFNLDTGMENGEYRTKTYEIEKIAYWPEGPTVYGWKLVTFSFTALVY